MKLILPNMRVRPVFTLLVSLLLTCITSTVLYSTSSYAAPINPYNSPPTLSLSAALLRQNGVGDPSANILSQFPQFQKLNQTGSSLDIFSPENFSALNASLSKLSFGNLTSSTSQQISAKLAQTSDSPDSRSVVAGIDLAREIGGLKSPALAYPGLRASSASLLTSGPDELLFGLFANQSLANFALNSSDLFSQVAANGLNPASSTAFRNATNTASAALSSSTLAGSLANPCAAGMLSSLSTGSSSFARANGVPSSCSPCFAAGQYLHNRMGDLFDTSGKYTVNNDSNFTEFEWNNLDQASRDSILKLNPGLKGKMKKAQAKNSAPSSSASSCSQASAGTENYLQSNLGSLLNTLGK